MEIMFINIEIKKLTSSKFMKIYFNKIYENAGILSFGDTTRVELGCRTAKEDCCRQKGIHTKKLRELLF